MTRFTTIPPGISLLRSLRGKDWSFSTYRLVVLLITFIAYTCYHASRKTGSIVKSVLDPKREKSSVLNVWLNGKVNVKKGWEPFNGKDGKSRLGEIDVAFLTCYAMGVYVAGHLGDNLDLRLFLSFGMIGSGIFTALFGMGYFWNIHEFWFFLLVQMISGLFQATGWPSVVAVIGNWFGKRKRGLIMGIWNAHTSVGNITGSLLAASVLEYGWGWCFIVPGGFIFLGGILVYLFLVPYPEDVGLGSNDQPLVTSCKSVGLFEALFIPGVIPFSLCLFFSKLVAYTFLYWLPFYLSQTGSSFFINASSSLIILDQRFFVSSKIS